MSPHRIRIDREESKVKDEDVIKTVEEVFDSFTNYHVYRLRNSMKAFKELKGAVSAGKEARVYWAKGWRGEDLAVKIYLTSSAEFRKSIKNYIAGDPRFPSVPSKFRDLVYLWARKEYGNLEDMAKAGVSVPTPVAVSGNVLVMRFLGENGLRAPLLVEAWRELEDEDVERMFNLLVDDIERMVCKARLVHGDLSEYNIMIWEGRPWIIDVAQAVSLDHPKSRELLERDLSNVFSFFSHRLDVSEKEESLRRSLEQCLEAS
ncbi:serine protein kinase RIO [Acidilobus sp.]|uniref:serine protein kinase RIO n=1 Tax=Acidilobus sp. TaxID=1872109 RepID=UPI003D02EBF7